jgi:hypothetical protein
MRTRSQLVRSGQRGGVVASAADFFRRRAAGARPSDLGAVLAMVPNRPPVPGDEVPQAVDSHP